MKLHTLFLILVIAGFGAVTVAATEEFAGGREEASAAVDDGRLIHLRSGSFDPLSRQIRTTSGVMDRMTRYAIVQFDSEAATATMRRLRDQGVAFQGYIPNDAWIVRYDEGARRLLARDDSVRWTGPYRPEFKVHPDLARGMPIRHAELVIVPFRDEGTEGVLAAMEKIGGGALLEVIDNGPLPHLRYFVEPSQRDHVVEQISKVPSVEWIEPHYELVPENVTSSQIIQGRGTTDEARLLFANGLTGTGQLIAIADTGVDVDSCFFTELNGVNAITEAAATSQPELGPLSPDNKIVGYWVQRFADPYDDNETCPGGGTATGFHGTHVAGSAVGDNFLNPSSPDDAGVDEGDGMAPNARLLFQDIGSDNGCLSGASDLFNTFLQAFEAGARTHSDSYGGDSQGSYSIQDLILDEFLFRHEAMSIFTSAGNGGPGASTISSPGNSKNVITVGAVTKSSEGTRIANFSARGPTRDGRVKPDLVAPGVGIVSAAGNSIFGDGNCDTRTSSGTSMSAPIAAGGSALVRQYFQEGRYPSGRPVASDEMELTAPLLKAILLNGTLPSTEENEFGGNIYGWGTIWLDNNLYFPGDAREMRVWSIPNVSGISEGEKRSFEISTTGDEELRVTLVWSDPAASLASEVVLINDLDLTVSNGVDTYVANVFDAQGISVPGGTPDRRNNVEQVRIASPGEGNWTVDVRGESIPGNGSALSDRQGFALVASHATCSSSVTGAPTRLSAVSNPVIGIDLRWEPTPGSTVTQLYRAPIEDPGNFQYIGTSTGSFFTDGSAQRAETFVYAVRGADGCGEGPRSETVTVTSNSGCDLEPEFEGAATATSASPNCAIILEWEEAELQCAFADSISYNIYRSTERDFVPRLGDEPFASVTDQTSFIDIDVTSGVRYHYIVRAEDLSANGDGPSGGEEEENRKTVSAVTSGPPTEFGTWTDDAGDTASLLNGDFPWHVTSQIAHESEFSYFAGVEQSTYPNLTCAALTTPSLSLGDVPVLSYWARYDLEINWDGVIVELSADGGKSWNDLPPDSGYPATLSETGISPINQCGYPPSQGAFTGPATLGLTEWSEYTSDLSAWAGETVMIRWRFTSDPADQQEGFYLDDISITDVGVPGPCIEIAIEPQAAFSFTPRTPLAGSPVLFSDLSSFEPESWHWRFGDGAESTSPDPEHTYLEPGTYEVTLTVTNSAGSDSLSKTITVYDNSLSWEIESVLTAQARTEGSRNSFFKTSLWATNPHASETTMRLRYLPTPPTHDGGAEDAVIFSIAANESIAFSDVLTEAFGAESNTAGAIAVEIPPGYPNPIVTSRTYNEPGLFTGTSGQYIPAVSLSDGDGEKARINGLGGDDSFRSNIGVANLDRLTIEAVITVLDPETGSPIGNPVNLEVPPYSSVQTNAINRKAGLGDLPLFGVRIDGSGRLFAYASKLDNVTSDPAYVPSTLSPKTKQWTDSVGAIPGSRGTFFRSNLTITNPNSSTATVTIRYTTRGNSSPVASREMTIEPGETLFFYDAVTELFPETGGVGIFDYESNLPVTVWVRTFNDRDLSGTLGQFIPAFGTEDLIPASGAILQGLSENSGFRTNVGIVNTGDQIHSLTVEVRRTDGTLAGSKKFDVRGGEALAKSRIMDEIVPGIEIADGYLRLVPSAPGVLYAWASSVDNRSTDQTFYRPIPIE